MRKFKESKGFTLIELMVVVAIIGILAAVAVPKFLQFMARTRKKEGETVLAGVFTTLESYYAQYEWFGGTDGFVLWRTGYAPSGEIRIYDADGGTVAFGVGLQQNTCTPADSGVCGAAATILQPVWGGSTDAESNTGGVGGPAAGVRQQLVRGFGFGACGNIDSDPSVDTYAVVESRRQPCNIYDDLTEVAGTCVAEIQALPGTPDPTGALAAGQCA